MFIIKLDDAFYVTMENQQIEETEEGKQLFGYTAEIEEAHPLSETEVASLLAIYKEEGFLSLGNTDFYDISLLETQLIIKREIKIKR